MSVKNRAVSIAAAVATLAVALSIAAASATRADSPADEARFITAVRDTVPRYAIPNGLYAMDPEVLGYGYEACAAMDRYPNDAVQAARVFYGHHGYPPSPPTITKCCSCCSPAPNLCNRHSEN